MANSKNEYGRIGQYRYGGILYEEFMPELRGQRGVQAYREMADNDDIVGAILFAVESLLRQADFYIEPASSSRADQKAAEFVESCMGDMQQSWADTISEILSFLTYGWSYHEIVYKRRMGSTRDPRTNSKYNDGLIGWRKLPIRAQETLWEWKYESDYSDELLGMVQSAPPSYGQIFIPLEKSLHFITKSRKNNPEGRSILRNAYRPWYFKKRIQEIEGVGIERDLAGFPVIYGPEDVDIWDANDEDMQRALANAERIVTEIRRDAREGLVMPAGWKLELLSSGSRRQFDTNQIIERYDNRIAMTVLADFILMGHQSVGSFALSSDKTRLFSVALGAYLQIICEVFNDQAIPRLIRMNEGHFQGISDFPKMKTRDIETPNLANLSNYVKELTGIGLLTPDQNLEDYMRRAASLPERMEENPTYEKPGQEKQEQQEDKGDQEQQQKPRAPHGKQQGNVKPKADPDASEEDKKDAERAAEAKKALGRK